MTRNKLPALVGIADDDTGVPCCFSTGKYKLALALKSGNFGAEDFYTRAADILRQYG